MIEDWTPQQRAYLDRLSDRYPDGVNVRDGFAGGEVRLTTPHGQCHVVEWHGTNPRIGVNHSVRWARRYDC